MNRDGAFRTPEQEVSRLLDEFASVREQMREIAATLSRLELRVKRAFPQVVANKQAKSAGKGAKAEATLTSEQALELYDRTVQQVKDGAPDEALDLLKELPLPDLLVLHRELGLTIGHGKPSRKAVLNGIAGRVKQSVMLSQHSNRDR
jgi:hypothetical protein